MSEEKQIDEMANTIYDNRPHKDVWLEDAQDIAKVLYDAGYRKQSEGEWIWKSNGYMKYLHCSCCGKQEDWEHKYCPNCGAKMKGGGE